MIKALTVYYTVWLILMEYYSILKRKEKEYASQKKKRNIDNIIIFKIIFKILEWVWRLWTEHHLFLH